MTETKESGPPKKSSSNKVYKCVKCRKLDAKYKRRDVDRLCKYCWDRLEYPAFKKLTNEEIDEIYSRSKYHGIKY
jgi:Holliday junction resolvase RusA-like endonuclease